MDYITLLFIVAGIGILAGFIVIAATICDC